MCLTRVACQVRDCLFKQPSKPSVHDRNRQLCVDIFNASRLRRGLPTMPVTEPAPAPPRSAAAVGGAPPGNDDDDDVDDETREIEKEMRDSLTIEAALVALIEHGNADPAAIDLLGLDELNTRRRAGRARRQENDSKVADQDQCPHCNKRGLLLRSDEGRLEHIQRCPKNPANQ